MKGKNKNIARLRTGGDGKERENVRTKGKRRAAFVKTREEEIHLPLLLLPHLNTDRCRWGSD